jgi:hypothetical protein
MVGTKTSKMSINPFYKNVWLLPVSGVMGLGVVVIYPAQQERACVDLA